MGAGRGRTRPRALNRSSTSHGAEGVSRESQAPTRTWYCAVTLGIHSLLLLTDMVETAVFALIFLTGRAEEKHFTDAADVDALYWHFAALSWVPLYALLYLSPRLL